MTTPENDEAGAASVRSSSPSAYPAANLRRHGGGRSDYIHFILAEG
jgi:hypothetical protein